MEALGLFEGREEREIELKHSDLSKSPIEPYLSDQWFVKMGDHADGRPGLAQLAIDAVDDGRVKFFPERYARSYLDWLGEKRDWCVSRQLWWGHRIPIWYTRAPEAELKRAFANRPGVSWKRDEENGLTLVCALEDLPSDALGGGVSAGAGPRRARHLVQLGALNGRTARSALARADAGALEYYYPTSARW